MTSTITGEFYVDFEEYVSDPINFINGPCVVQFSPDNINEIQQQSIVYRTCSNETYACSANVDFNVEEDPLNYNSKCAFMDADPFGQNKNSFLFQQSHPTNFNLTK